MQSIAWVPNNLPSPNPTHLPLSAHYQISFSFIVFYFVIIYHHHLSTNIMADPLASGPQSSRREGGVGVVPLYVLYGSQTGNSEQAAKDFCHQLNVRYTPDFFRTNNLSPVQVRAKCLQLDDFLEVHHAAYTKALVIFVSSYGVGQAPLGAYRFRSLADAFLSSERTKEDNNKILQGLQYAICGLGAFLFCCLVRWLG
jgi:sulfite reductase alpha subunit-like flavoprotein